jgi:transposase
MPWKECSVMDERLRLVAQLLDGEAMSEVCRAFGISRKTGYKIFERYKEHGLEALTDRSRRPVRYANQLPRQIESLIVAAKRDKPHWGARKIRELLVRRLDGDIRVPAKSTIHAERRGGRQMGARRHFLGALESAAFVEISGDPDGAKRVARIGVRMPAAAARRRKPEITHHSVLALGIGPWAWAAWQPPLTIAVTNLPASRRAGLNLKRRHFAGPDLHRASQTDASPGAGLRTQIRI